MLQTSTLTQLPNFTLPAYPNSAPRPELIAWNESLAAELALGDLTADPERTARVFSGAAPVEGVRPVALAYAGHQFGQFVPRLGDGRAALLGEVTGTDGRRYDVQLKGSGATPFSRGGDGKSAIGPVLREYIVSEAMHRLGVPTTRALAAVATGERVLRENVMPGAVFTRVAASHLRIGSFEYFAAQGDAEAVRALADYAIRRHYPDVEDSERRYVDFLASVAARQAELVAGWMSVGFIHGVMNTDNTSIAGETLDYGPCAFMDEFRHDKVFSSIDRHGRYSYSNQAPIAQWNLARLAECLLLVSDRHEDFEKVVYAFIDDYETHYLQKMRAKFGLTTEEDGDDSLIRDFLDLLEARDLDYTLSFRTLAERAGADDESVFGEIETRWRARLAGEGGKVAGVRARMNAVNPLFIPRNHRIEEAIAGAVDGDFSVFHELNRVLARPFEAQPELARYENAPAADERVSKTFCGT